MGLQVAFAWSNESAQEMERMGFEKREVYVKRAPAGCTTESNEKGDSEFFGMEHMPYQFITTSYWGNGAA